MKKILIVGATSSIAHTVARFWAVEKASFYLVSRNSEKLKIVADDLRVRGSNEVFVKTVDINDVASHKDLIKEAYRKLGEIDVIFVAHGTLSNQSECQTSVEMAMSEINNNGLSTIAFLTEISRKLEIESRGTLAVISSVAGDRGRKSNYVYGSSKAMVTVFLEGLQHRFSDSPVKVVIIKPGPTLTPMTLHLRETSRVRLAPVESVSKVIFKGINKGSSVIYAPKIWRLIMFIIKILPPLIFNKLDL